tara:strand:+ start:187 stop:699 length:513 start_codon:yes stop_codon:yes gene_type:complete
LHTNQIKAELNTNKGTINLFLFYDDAPITVSNFINLSQRGYYNNLTFHRVINDFMIQGGCPNGNGMGGPGYNFEDEFDSNKIHDRAGVLSMANSGPNTNGSQFFITHVATPWLDGNHTVFGMVQNDQDQLVVDSIVQGDIIESINIHDYNPIDNDRIIKEIKRWNLVLDN